MKMIPITDPKKQLLTIKDDIFKSFHTVFESGQYILGPQVEQLERNIANRLGVSEAIAVASGTDALVLTLHAYGIGPGDEVITTPFTFFATAEAISRTGATPVFVDVDRETFNINPALIREKLTPATKAIIPVHIFGQPANMTMINEIADEHGCVVIEDACQAFGARYQEREVGSLGDAACFSFFPTKNLSTLGDGGMITTSDQTIADKIRSLRAHGSTKKYFHNEIGYNSRLDELHASILLTCLNHIDSWNEGRMIRAHYYMDALKQVSYIALPKTLKNVTHVYHLFCLETDFRTQLIEHLIDHNIQVGIYYPRCLHLQEAYTGLGYSKGDFPVAELLSEKLFAIPLYPLLKKHDQDLVISALKSFGEIHL